MIHVPEDIKIYYREQLQTISKDKHHNFVKWIRFYLDFCAKYRFTIYEKDSFSHFSQKLTDKGQNVEDIEEAFQAVQLLLPYYSSGLKAGALEDNIASCSIERCAKAIGIITPTDKIDPTLSHRQYPLSTKRLSLSNLKKTLSNRGEALST